MDRMETHLDSQVSQQSPLPSSNSKKPLKKKVKILENAIKNKKKHPKKPLVDLRQFEVFTASAIEKTLKFSVCPGDDESAFSKLGFHLAENLLFSSGLVPGLSMTSGICKQQYESLLEMKYSIMSVRLRFGMDVWGLAAQLVNPYENLPCVTSPGLSRAFFKMWEVMKNFDLIKSVVASPRFVSVHLCEGPGGFIQAVQRYRNNSATKATLSDNLCQHSHSVDTSFQNEYGESPINHSGKLHTGREDLWFALTLASSVGNLIPKALDKTKLEGFYHPQVDIGKLEGGGLGYSKGHVHYGADQTGDITNPANIDSFVDYVLKCNNGEKVGVVTADGAMDASDDFSMQENSHLQIAFCEICTAVKLQAKGGAFVLKIFDCFSEATVMLLIILASLYKHVEIVRLRTTRICSSERYVVVREFQGLTHLVEERLMAIASDWYKASQNGEIGGLRVLNCPPRGFYESLLLCNAVIAKIQCEAITKAIHVASVLGDLLPDTFEKRKGLMSMLRRKIRVLNTMNQNAYTLCNDLNIPLRNEHNFNFGSHCDS